MGPTPIRLVVLLAAAAVAASACGSSSGSSAGGSQAAVAPASRSASSPGVAAGAGGAATPEVGSTAGVPAAAPRGADTGLLGTTVTPASADVVETGSIDLRLADAAGLRTAYRTVSGLATGAGGFVASSSLSDGALPTAAITLRLPDAMLGGVMGRVDSLGRVTAQTSSGRDVTGEVVDLGVEIRNLSSEEAAVRALLAHAGSVKDILTVQQQLFALQDEIQQLTAQSNTLDNRVQYATLAVALTTTALPRRPVHHHPSVFARFWSLARTHTADVVRGAFLAVGWAMPALVGAGLVAVAWLAFRRFRRTAVVAPAGGGAPEPD